MESKIPDFSTVRNILTLRYDPLQKTSLPKIDVKNFQNKEPLIKHIEYLIEKSLNSLSPTPKKIAIALSGGIDSTLVLYFLCKVFPEATIEAISIKFTDSIDESITASKIAEHFGIKHHVIVIENHLK